ncbi:MAG: ORF6N domain-containing protein [Bacilli bacterium]|nr:ORF6N domain-containing protein [Bacilli bacterium]
MNELALNEELKIEDMIYEIRGKQVMLDSDLAYLYKCKNGTKSINLAVKRHIKRFPERFMFQLTEEECKECLRFQFETLNINGNKRGQHIKYLPYAFTEQGVAMLATILNTEVAEEVSIKIMDAFVAMRHYISNNLLEHQNITNLILEDHNNIRKNTIRINLLEKSLKKLEENKEINEIYFDGKIYDAHSLIIDIFSMTKNELIIIDRYTDKTILDMIKNLKCDVKLITGQNTKLTKLDIDKYNKDYNNLTIYYDDTFNDRYFILDRNKIYHSGNSVNHIGYRKSSLNLLKDKSVKASILNDVDKIIMH